MPMPSRTSLVPALLLTALVAVGSPGEALEMSLSHSALERLVWQVLLTEGGRGYFEGGPEDTCRFAFVQEPKVTARDGRLRIRFLFSGRAGAEVAGRCVGPGDTFEIFVSGVPALAAGELYFEDLRVEAPDTAYFRLVRSLVERQLRERLRYPMKQDLDWLAATVAAPAGYAMAVDRLERSEVTVDDEGLRVGLDLALSIR